MMNEQVKAILVDIIDPKTSKFDALKRLEELESLINTYGGVAIMKVIQKRNIPDYQTFIGKGKVEEILQEGKELQAQIVVVNNILKPKHIFNLDEAFKSAKMKAWDRIDLILKIFDKHAQSSLAKLQIELASIRHMGPRIYNMGIELSQQTGAVGLRSGAGETNIEVMKRHLQGQELSIVKKLKHYQLIDEGHRKRRKKQNCKTVALVGYTNAGKSSIMHALTGKDVYIADKLFATLDTRIGKLYIQPKEVSQNGEYIPGKELLISDTIGFIQDLPPSLIQAFKSTLAETIEADLILHIIDISDEQMEKKVQVVEEILDQIGLHDKPKIYVFNKIDLIEHADVIASMQKTLLKESRTVGLLPAGRHTAKILGWLAKEEFEKERKIKKPSKNIAGLIRKYKEFVPVFVSAEKKVNLESLIDQIELSLP